MCRLHVISDSCHVHNLFSESWDLQWCSLQGHFYLFIQRHVESLLVTQLAILVPSKDKTHNGNVVFFAKLAVTNAEIGNVGETSSSCDTTFKEYSRLKTPFTAIGEHSKNHNYNLKIGDAQGISFGWEHFWKWKIQETIYIDTHPVTTI